MSPVPVLVTVNPPSFVLVRFRHGSLNVTVIRVPLSRVALCSFGGIISTVSVMLFAIPSRDAVKTAVPSPSTDPLPSEMLTTLSSLDVHVTPFIMLAVKSDLTPAAVSAAARKTGETETRAASVSSIL